MLPIITAEAEMYFGENFNSGKTIAG